MKKPAKPVEAIRTWMERNAHRFVDLQTGEVDCTLMVETWDIECANGAATLDPDHEAWEIATEVRS